MSDAKSAEDDFREDGFATEITDDVDDYSATVFVFVRLHSDEPDGEAIHRRVAAIAELYNGICTSYAYEDETARQRQIQ